MAFKQLIEACQLEFTASCLVAKAELVKIKLASKQDTLRVTA